MLNRVGNLRNFAEASRLPILARRRSIKNSVSVCGEQFLAYAKVRKDTYHQRGSHVFDIYVIKMVKRKYMLKCIKNTGWQRETNMKQLSRHYKGHHLDVASIQKTRADKFPPFQLLRISFDVSCT